MRDRIRVPLLGYFAIVAPVLLGCLFAADAFMEPGAPMKFAAAAPVLALATKRPPAAGSVQILTVREAVPVRQSALTAVENIPQAATSQVKPPKKKVARAAADHKKKRAKVIRTPETRDRYAQSFQPTHAVR